MPDPIQVKSMFGRIAGRYDLLNRLLSVGIDRRWRSIVLRHAGDVRGRTVVDACCGTGDLTFAFAEHGARVVGVDFTPEMLARAIARSRRPKATSRRRSADGHEHVFVEGDAQRLPVKSGSADLATVAFGIRNVADRSVGLGELARVVRPGGTVFVLEFSMPKGRLLGALYRFYFMRVLPTVGGWISGDAAAYRYLPETVVAWPTPDELQREMEAIGLTVCGYQLLTGGVACLSWGRAPARA